MNESAGGVTGWFTFYRKGMNYFAYSMHRLSGLVIVVYLYLHLAVLSNLLIGKASYDSIIRSMAYGPFGIFIIMDVLLSIVIFYHGANGVRLVLNESGFALKYNKILFYLLESIAVIVLLLFLYYAWEAVLSGAGV